MAKHQPRPRFTVLRPAQELVKSDSKVTDHAQSIHLIICGAVQLFILF